MTRQDDDLDAIVSDALGIQSGQTSHQRPPAANATPGNRSRKPRAIPTVDAKFHALSGCASTLNVSAAFVLLGGIVGAVLLVMRGEILSAVGCFLSADFTAFLLFAAGCAAECLVQTERNTRQATALLEDLRSVI